MSRRAKVGTRAPQLDEWSWLLVIGCVLALCEAVLGQRPMARAESANPASADVSEPAASAAPPLGHGFRARPAGEPIPERDRPPGALADDAGPSTAIFPPQQITIRFNHERHVKELGLNCTSCHEKARTSHEAAESLLPLGTRCDGCHGSDHRDSTRVLADPEAEHGQCAFCHLGYDPTAGNEVVRMRVPKPNLRFDHALHFGRKIGCAQCHGSVEELKLATRDQLPRMRGCLNCHQAPSPASGRARSECSTCHITESSGMIQASFESGALLPPSWLHDAAHGPDWIERHKGVAANDSRFCANCHTEKSCADCHDGRVRPRRIHPNDWLEMHPLPARQNQQKCASCHHDQSFCLTCHERAGISMSGPFGNSAERGRFHPPKAEWSEGPRGPRHHAWEAERNISACVSCHVERDCALCHATAARGGRGSGYPAGGDSGLDPHPLGFRARCSSALRQNARPCLVCHALDDPNLLQCR